MRLLFTGLVVLVIGFLVFRDLDRTPDRVPRGAGQSVSAPAPATDQPSWSAWERQHSVAIVRDWRVIKQPDSGDCYLKQSYDKAPSKIELSVAEGRPTLITPFFRGIDGPIEIAIDDGPPRQVVPANPKAASSVPLNPDLIPKMKAGRVLRVTLRPDGEDQRTQSFSLMGFTAASQWLEKEECRNGPQQEQKPAVATSAPAQNVAHKMLQQKSRAEQTALLGAGLVASGERCEATNSEFKGLDRVGTANYLIYCRGGSDFIMSIFNDAEGSSRILSCDMARVLGVDCYAKW